MRELSKQEIAAVSGGIIDQIGFLKGIGFGLRVGAVGAALTASYYAGFAIGTVIYNSYTTLRY